MTRLAAVFGERAAARERVRAVFGGAGIDTPEFVAGWSPSDPVDSAQAADVICILAGRPYRGGRRVAAAQLADAYRDGSPDLLGMRGGFTVLLWAESSKRGLVATDHLGVLAPVFRRVGTELIVAGEPRDLLPLLPTAPGPDERVLVEWIGSGELDPEATFYAAVERLPGGHLLERRGRGWSRLRYHRFEYRRGVERSREEVEGQVRTAVEAAVRSRLDAVGTTGLLLSGGLDSAVVAAAAKERPLPSFSLVFPRHPEVDERPLIEAVAAELQLESTLEPFSGGPFLPAAAAFIDEWRVPPASPTLAIQLPLLQTAAAAGTTTLLDGQGGDELFGTPVYLLADELRHGRLRSALALARRLPGVPESARGTVARRAFREFGLKGAVPYAAHRLAGHGRRVERRAPPWFTRSAAAAYRDARSTFEWKRAAGPRWWAGLLDSVTVQRERSGAHEYLRRRNALAGIVGAHPLLHDVELIEVVLGLPPRLAFDPVFDRPLLRSALPNVPAAIRARTAKAFFTPLFLEAVDLHDATAIRTLIEADDAMIRAFVQPELVREHLLDAPAGRRGEERAWALWRTAVAELWLRRIA
jgi:asparagine synthase (glutamine-hydrolysing)